MSRSSGKRMDCYRYTRNENDSNMSARSYTFNIGKINLVILHMTIGNICRKLHHINMSRSSGKRMDCYRYTRNENDSNMSARSYTFNIGKINLVILHMTIGNICRKLHHINMSRSSGKRMDCYRYTRNENDSNMSARSYTLTIGKINLFLLHRTMEENLQKTSSY